MTKEVIYTFTCRIGQISIIRDDTFTQGVIQRQLGIYSNKTNINQSVSKLALHCYSSIFKFMQFDFAKVTKIVELVIRSKPIQVNNALKKKNI